LQEVLQIEKPFLCFVEALEPRRTEMLESLLVQSQTELAEEAENLLELQIKKLFVCVLASQVQKSQHPVSLQPLLHHVHHQ
jgi:hypothetical protein